MVSVTLSARIHDEARVASAQFTLPPQGLASLRDLLTAQLRVIVRWADETGALVGHVKAYLQWGDGQALMLSTTGGAVECKGSPLPAEDPAEADVGVTAIVFGAEPEAVEARLTALCSAVAGARGDWCAFAHAEHHHHHADGETCDDPDCDCHDHDHAHEHEHKHEHEHEHEHHHHAD